MKTRQVALTVPAPRFMGRSEGDMISEGKWEQLDLFRETLTRTAKLQVIAMLALSNPKHLDLAQEAKVADIARAMGYEADIRADGKTAFPSWIYEAVEETGMKLRRKSFDIFYQKPDGFTTDGKRRKWKGTVMNLSILQEFGFYYEDEEGRPIDLKAKPQDELIRYEAVQGGPLFAIPALNENGKIIRNKDGTPRRRLANGIRWRFASYFADLAKNRETSWIIYIDQLTILRKYLTKPASFDLIWKTIFWTGKMPIEFGHDQLVVHLNIRSKDQKQVQKAIDEAFSDMLNEGIIDKPVIVREAGYYKPTPKTGRRRRVGKVYQWTRASKWNPGQKLIAIDMDGTESYNEGKADKPKA